METLTERLLPRQFDGILLCPIQRMSRWSEAVLRRWCGHRAFSSSCQIRAPRGDVSARTKKRVRWEIACRPGTVNKLKASGEKALVKREKSKARIRAKVEHPFRVIKCQFGWAKVRFKGLAKHTAHLFTLFALSNLWMARKRLLAMTGELRAQ
jgi:hypothetical protein